MADTEAGEDIGGRDRDTEGRARNARPRDGLGRPLPYGADGVERQPEGVVRSPDETVTEAQALLDAGKPFHAHEVFEDAWKSGPDAERELWRGLAQIAVGLTHSARGNTTGGPRLLRRGAAAVTAWSAEQSRPRPYDLDLPGLATWAGELAGRVERTSTPIDAATESPRLTPAPPSTSRPPLPPPPATP
ncbi:DUF309 domain-containing protein [Streptomyces sp. NPDC007903]|uniref:DUF309 domain-containing protein n=1 Tax=Streptomyces sp. NPDC007903 TaxID=3364786 RepID=UPI0036E0ACE1